MKKNYLFTAVIVYLRLFFPPQYEASSTHIIHGMWRQKKKKARRGLLNRRRSKPRDAPYSNANQSRSRAAAAAAS